MTVDRHTRPRCKKPATRPGQADPHRQGHQL